LGYKKIRVEAIDYAVERRKRSRGEVRQALSRFHQLEIDVGTQVEVVESLVEHLAVLAGRAQEELEVSSVFAKADRDWSELNDLRSRAEHKKDPRPTAG
jgi:hypothetical protein